MMIGLPGAAVRQRAGQVQGPERGLALGSSREWRGGLVYTTAFWVALLVAGLSSQQPAPPSPASSALGFEVFRTKVQPIFVAKRPGHARCISCHTTGTPLRLQPLAPGSASWTEEQSRKNFETIQRVVVPGSVKSRLLIHPLAEEAGGDFFHNGGKHWSSQNDPEWQTLRAWVLGAH